MKFHPRYQLSHSFGKLNETTIFLYSHLVRRNSHEDRLKKYIFFSLPRFSTLSFLRYCRQLTISISYEIYSKTKDLLFSFSLKCRAQAAFVSPAKKMFGSMAFLINTNTKTFMELGKANSINFSIPWKNKDSKSLKREAIRSGVLFAENESFRSDFIFKR